VRHRSSEDLWVHLRDLESNLLPLRVECVDGVLQVMVAGLVPSRQCLPLPPHKSPEGQDKCPC
jgi:hypothetical protein